MRKTALRTLASLAVLAVLSVPHATTPQTCANPAARNLLAGALADSVLNPPNQEDNQFFTSQAGFPNIFFVIDTSDSMARLPANGPAFLAGASDPAFLPTTTKVGCGTDPELGDLAANPMLDVVASRTYHSPCGGSAIENTPYAGHIPLAAPSTFGVVGGLDYAAVGSVCPHYTPSNTYAYGDPGYDPDFYAVGASLSSGGGKPNLFPRDMVFHDSVGEGPAYSRTTAPLGNGWDFTTVYPYKTAGNAAATIEQFCAGQGATLQNGLTREQICLTCMAKKGWYYDGTIQTQTQDSVTNVPYPSIWYTGNYLSFYPPKFVVARKVVKDVIAAQTKIRMAMAQFGASGYTFVRDFNPSCQSVFGGGNWEQNRSTYINDVNALDWGGGTPLSLALFDVGRYYHTATLPWFGAAWENSGGESATSANQLAVCWSCQASSIIMLTDGVPSLNDGNTLPPGSSSIADSDTGKYAGATTTGILGASTADCPRCADFTGADSYKNNLTKVAFYLHNYDLRGEAAGSCGGNGGTLDGKGMPGKQVLDLYTVGFGVGQIPDASRILGNAAHAGGGLFVGADSADLLRDGITKVFTEINDRATSFSVATVSTLQTTTGHSVIVPRFDPSRDPHWAGHLYRYELYSEFVNACTPNGVGDLDCDGLCASVFLQDKDGKFIAEDGNGHFVRTDNNLPSCSQTPRCVALGKACGALTNVPASPWWDAYEALKAQTWRSRYVWTVTDSDADGKLTAADALVRLETTNAAADKLVPYLGLGTTGGVCAGIAQRILTAGDPVTAAVVSASKRECAKTIIRFVLGADVLNEMGRNASQGWPPPRPDPSSPATVGDPTAIPPIAANLPDQDQLLDRRFKLGDIYHSSPVVVDAPLPADGILCAAGLHNQCLESLWRTPVRHVNDVNQYDLYAKSAALKNRRKVILVGSNDGLLHALNGGGWHPNADDPVTAGIDESKAPFEGYYDRGEQDGGPVELWAFLPPDLLGKIPAMLGTEHQLLVDGTAMVRDVWVDGASNGVVTPSADLDGKKAASEFHTVAIVGERRGGNHYFALDVTTATALPAESGDHSPKFLWVYPQPSDAESLTFGETYTEFLPVPPPIGPVRIKADGNAQAYGLADATNAPSMYVPETPTVPVKYHELWVTMLPGGLDPQFLRGRGVHMVDVWTGKEVLDFSYPADPATVSWMDTRIGLTYPVVATPAMVMWGKQVRRPTLGWENDGYFDTSTFGDMGGQLWVVRFNRPGVMNAGGKVQNWYGGRIFTHGYSWTPSLCTEYLGHPFFYITANTALPREHVYRVYAGTGDRFNLLDTNGGICGPDNIRACVQSGCTVSIPLADNAITATGIGYNGQGLDQPACWTAVTRSQDLATAPPLCGARAFSRIEVSACPNATGATGFTKDVGVRCRMDADGDYGCKAAKATISTALPAYGSPLTLANNLSSHPRSRNWYFSLKVFDDTGPHAIFDDEYNAYLYDWYRMTLYDGVWSLSPVSSWATSWNWTGQSLVHIDGSSNNPTTLADANSTGWAIYYNHGPTITTEDHTYNVNLLDERTSSVSGLYGKVLWNTMQPALGEAITTKAGCSQSKCQAAFRRLSYHYGADAVTGGPVFKDDSGNPLRAIVQNTLVPAQGDQPTVFVNQKGQSAVGLTAVNPEKGASNLGMGKAKDPVMGLGVVEVSRDLHECRHFKAAAADGTLSAVERAALETKCKALR